MAEQKYSIALWHRYGPAAHSEEYPCLPDLITELAKNYKVHYFGMKTNQPVPPVIETACKVHFLPFYVNRASMRDKTWKTILWYLAIPWMALYCRFHKITALFIDESLPFSFFFIRLFYGRNIARTLTDFFLDIYLGKSKTGMFIAKMLNNIEIMSWKSLPIIITRVQYTKNFLISKGFQPDRIKVIYNPCNLNLYKPTEKNASRRKYSIPDNAVVLVHHGVLHPNKANDRILRVIAEIKETVPQIHYLLIGSGPELLTLKRLAAELNIQDRVTFTGWLPTEEEVVEAINAADMGLVMRKGLESDNYHVTNTLVHEMACGLPIIAAKLAGVAEIITDGINGILFNPTDMNEFKEKLIKLAGDRTLRTQLGKMSRETAVKCFDKTKIALDTASALREHCLERKK